MRKRIALAVVGLHALLLWLVVIMHRWPQGEEPQQPQFVTAWIEPAAPQPSASAVSPARARREPEQVRRAAPSAPARTVVPPTTAPAAPPDLPAPANATPSSNGPMVDWRNEATLAGRRAVDTAAAAARAETFSPPPKVTPPACKPKDSSMEWKGAQDDGLSWAGPMPVYKTKRCVFTLIGFACNPGWIPPANSHLLDDKDAPDRAPSSVPDPNVCD